MFQAYVCVCVCVPRYGVSRLSVAVRFMRKFFLFKKHFLWIYTKLMWNSKEPLLLDEFTVYIYWPQMNCIFQTNFFLICIVYRTRNIFEQKSTGLFFWCTYPVHQMFTVSTARIPWQMLPLS